MTEIISYVCSGIAILAALLALVIPNRSLGKKIGLCAAVSAAIGLFAPSIGFYLWMLILAGLFVAFIGSIIHGFKTIRW